MHYSPVRRSSASSKLDLLPLDLHVLGLPPAFNLSHDQTLQFKIDVVLTCHPVSDRSEPNLAQGSNEFIQYRLRKAVVLESLALIFGDLSPSSASAHMNYLIKLLKSSRLRAKTT